MSDEQPADAATIMAEAAQHAQELGSSMSGVMVLVVGGGENMYRSYTSGGLSLGQTVQVLLSEALRDINEMLERDPGSAPYLLDFLESLRHDLSPAAGQVLARVVMARRASPTGAKAPS